MNKPQLLPMPDLLTAEQVARLLSVSVRTVWRLLARGQLPQPVRYNRKLVRWRTSDITAYVEGLKPGKVG